MAASARPSERLLSPKEVMERLGIGRHAFFNLTRSGELPSRKVGKYRKVREADLDRYISEGAA